MKRPLARLLAAPEFDDRDATSTAKVLHWICWTVLAILTATVLTLLGVGQTRAPLAICACVFAVTVGALWLLRAGRVRTAAISFTVSLWAILVTATALFGGTRSPSFFTFFAVVLFAGFLLGGPAAITFAVLSAAAGAAITWAEARGLLPAPSVPVTSDRLLMAMVAEVAAAAALLHLALRSIKAALENARSSERLAVEASRGLARREEQQAIIADLGRRALACEDLSDVFDDCVRIVAQTIDAELCEVLELLPGAGQFLLRSGVGWNEGLVGHAVVGTGRESQAGYTLETDGPVVVDDFATETRFKAPSLLRDHRVMSGITCVIHGHGGPWGVLGAHSLRPRNFGGSETPFLNAVANVLAAAIERKRLEEDLRRSQKLEAIGQLAGGVAHDFNNLLTVINGYAEILLTTLERDPDLWGAAEAIHEAANRATSMTQQLLVFSGRRSVARSPVNLNVLVRTMCEMLQRLIGVDIAVRLDLDPELGPVLANAGHLEQVIMNLALNSRDAMPGGGTITIETRNLPCPELPCADGGIQAGVPQARIVVSDDGIGMRPELQSRIFEPFFTTKEPGKGTGLGLATVYGIVKQSGGEIRVESRPGCGTRFEIDLPQAEDAADVGFFSVPGQQQQTVERARETILLVEDDDAVRRLAREVLERSGYTVLNASNGREALEVEDQHERPIHALVTDVMMPEMGGIELSWRVRSRRPGIRILFISGYDKHGSAAHLELPEGAVVLAKPFPVDSLVAKLRELLQA